MNTITTTNTTYRNILIYYFEKYNTNIKVFAENHNLKLYNFLDFLNGRINLDNEQLTILFNILNNNNFTHSFINNNYLEYKLIS